MDIIKKTITIEGYKTHTPAIIPFYKVDGTLGDMNIKHIPSSTNTAWGGVLCDCNTFTASTMDLLSKYYELCDILRSGTKMKRIKNNNKVYYTVNYDDNVKSYMYNANNIDLMKPIKNGVYEQVSGQLIDESCTYVVFVPEKEYERYVSLGGRGLIDYVENNIIGIIYVPNDVVGSKVPDKIYITEIDKMINWFTSNETKHDESQCCPFYEWDERGGDKMLHFLKDKRGVAFETYERIRQTYDNYKAPYINIPVLFTQNYDDIGTMSVYNEQASYTGNERGNGEPYTDGVTSESKLQMLKSKVRGYDDYGNELPYIDGDKPPYREGEVFNISYDVKTGKYIGDYIKEITYLDENGSATTIENAVSAEIEYVIGGEYENSGDIKITSDEKIVSYSGSTVTLHIESTKEWVVTSNCDWFYTQTTAGTGNMDIIITFEENTSTTESRIATISVVSKDKYDEAYYTIIQLTTPSVVPCDFAGSTPSNMVFYNNKLTQKANIRCNGSGWYLKSKPSFVEITTKNGLDGVSTEVVLTCDVYHEAEQRTGEVVFAATDYPNITYVITIAQAIDERSRVTGFKAEFYSTSASSTTISYSESDTIIGYVKKDGEWESTDISWYTFEILDPQYAGYFVILRSASSVTIKNTNTSNNDVDVRIRVYSGKLTSTVKLTLKSETNNV